MGNASIFHRIKIETSPYTRNFRKIPHLRPRGAHRGPWPSRRKGARTPLGVPVQRLCTHARLGIWPVRWGQGYFGALLRNLQTGTASFDKVTGSMVSREEPDRGRAGWHGDELKGAGAAASASAGKSWWEGKQQRSVKWLDTENDSVEEGPSQQRGMADKARRILRQTSRSRSPMRSEDRFVKVGPFPVRRKHGVDHGTGLAQSLDCP
jgi:hypothetical protein